MPLDALTIAAVRDEVRPLYDEIDKLNKRIDALSQYTGGRLAAMSSTDIGVSERIESLEHEIARLEKFFSLVQESYNESLKY